ncbi:MAG: hypothetical protein QOG10_324 [Kribbellaceae bacterium]|jgi:hypothetical protein|nr:hypothetical protein [Kribbellaceae bacterium]
MTTNVGDSAAGSRPWATVVRALSVVPMALLLMSWFGLGQHAQAFGAVVVSAADRARMDAALAAAGPEQRAYIGKAIAVGHSANEVVRFAEAIRGKEAGWLRTHLSLIDPSGTGGVSYHGSELRQIDDTTCGSTSLLVARAMADPLYDLYLTTGDSTDPAAATAAQFQARVAAEERRIHAATNLLWPESLGTSPWGVSGELNRHVGVTETRYGTRLVDGTHGGRINRALRDAVAAVDSGQPVPVLIGDLLPHHYVLMVGHRDSDLLFYDPGYAEVVVVSEQAFLTGDLSTLGYRHLMAVITPSR